MKTLVILKCLEWSWTGACCLSGSWGNILESVSKRDWWKISRCKKHQQDATDLLQNSQAYGTLHDLHWRHWSSFAPANFVHAVLLNCGFICHHKQITKLAAELSFRDRSLPEAITSNHECNVFTKSPLMEIQNIKCVSLESSTHPMCWSKGLKEQWTSSFAGGRCLWQTKRRNLLGWSINQTASRRDWLRSWKPSI